VIAIVVTLYFCRGKVNSWESENGEIQKKILESDFLRPQNFCLYQLNIKIPQVIKERSKTMPDIFEKTEIKNMTLKNRFVRSATWEGMAGEDGSCTQRLTDLMDQLAN